MTTYKFSNFPIAIVAFGKNLTSTDSEKLKEHLAVLKTLAHGISQALEYGQNYASNLETSAFIAGKVASVMTVLVMLIGEVEVLYKELKKLEQKIFNTILEGKLRALNSNIKNLEDPRTSDGQKVAEIVSAITNLNELLPVFSNEDSIFRERYYEGASLFVRFCAILKAICLIAEQTTDYNTSNLQSLKECYQKMLDWYTIMCIGRRMASCYVADMLNIVDRWYDWNRHYYKHEKYYDMRNTSTNLWPLWRKYAENLGGKGWRLWYQWGPYINLIDTWDTRPHDEVKFEPWEIKYQGYLESIPFYRVDVLTEYRQRVEKVMLEFFNQFSITTE